MPKKDQGWITFQSSAEERRLLEQYCQQSQRSKTEVLRELLRNLTPSQPIPPPKATSTLASQPIWISARNHLRGTVKAMLVGDVNAEVTVEIAPGIDIVAVITRSSVERLGVVTGKTVCVAIKSSDVMIAIEPE